MLLECGGSPAILSRPVAKRLGAKPGGYLSHGPETKWELVSPPAPTCPRSEYRAGEGLASFLGGSGLSLRSKLRRGPCRVPAEVLRPRSVPFRGPSARRLRSPLDLRRKWDRPKPHASSSRARSTASVACAPKSTARFRGGRVSQLSSVAGSPFLIAKGHNGAAIRFAKGESCPFCLWITGISRISPRKRAAARNGPAPAPLFAGTGPRHREPPPAAPWPGDYSSATVMALVAE
jgi:hypothetical protein